MEDQRELQLLPTPSTRRITGWALGQPVSSNLAVAEPVDAPSLDLQLRIEALRWHSAEQIRLAAIERAYAEQIRELTRKEMELAQSEFARARLMWKKVQEEVENAERQKVRATYQIDSSCMEITCQACQQRFRP
ncbi:hypothetical protein Syun_024504 [Stephania yunnanensis]|uniref:Protein SHOOT GRAVITROPISM 5 n=1 Tax=Stephania yunnanensis TaxID=152371 RepID=A0AAP0I4J1_9MAGN